MKYQMWVLLEIYILMFCYCYYAGVLDLHTIVAFFQSFVNAYCEWEKKGIQRVRGRSRWWQQISKSFTYFVFHYTSCPPSFVNFWRLYILTQWCESWIFDMRKSIICVLSMAMTIIRAQLLLKKPFSHNKVLKHVY